MKNRIKDDVKEQFLNSLQTIISYPSVLNEGENGTPFGQAIQDVLEKTLELARELGFQTYIDPEDTMDMQRSVRGKNSWPFFVTWMLFQPVI